MYFYSGLLQKTPLLYLFSSTCSHLRTHILLGFRGFSCAFFLLALTYLLFFLLASFVDDLHILALSVLCRIISLVQHINVGAHCFPYFPNLILLNSCVYFPYDFSLQSSMLLQHRWRTGCSMVL